jgi:hypothetical protein
MGLAAIELHFSTITISRLFPGELGVGGLDFRRIESRAFGMRDIFVPPRARALPRWPVFDHTAPSQSALDRRALSGWLGLTASQGNLLPETPYARLIQVSLASPQPVGGRGKIGRRAASFCGGKGKQFPGEHRSPAWVADELA